MGWTPKNLELVPNAGSFSLLGVDIWNPDGVETSVDIHVENSVVRAIVPSGSCPFPSPCVSARGLVVLPAGVDNQVHLRVPGQSHKEKPHTGLYAALKGGIGAVLTMPNTNPVIDSLDSLEKGLKEIAAAQEETGVQVLWSAALTRGQDGEALVDVELLKNKISAFTDDGKGVESDGLMLKGLQAIQDTGIPFLQHAEFSGHKGILAPSQKQREIGVPAYPDSAEVDMVARDIDLLRKARGARYHVLHVSSAKTVELIRKAKGEGLNVTAEVTPHHLYFTAEDIKPDNTAFKMNPPLRTEADRQALIRGLASGVIDYVATDHAPHEKEAKSRGFSSAPFGTIGLETALPVLLFLYRKGELSKERLVQVFSTKPAEFLSLEKQFGRIKVGRPFNACVVDIEASETVTEDYFESSSKNSCFLGETLPGRVVATFVHGRTWRRKNSQFFRELG